MDLNPTVLVRPAGGILQEGIRLWIPSGRGERESGQEQRGSEGPSSHWIIIAGLLRQRTLRYRDAAKASAPSETPINPAVAGSGVGCGGGGGG
jgi:hypothetical protein